MVALVDELLGSDRTHIPLFRRFPHSVPEDTDRLYVDRVFSFLTRQPAQPCVICGAACTVLPVDPCAHLVCRMCWNAADYTSCPVCCRPIDRADPFLRAAGREPKAAPFGSLRLLRLGTDRDLAVLVQVNDLLAYETPISPQDREDLAVLLAAVSADLAWLPEEIPVRETKALGLGCLLYTSLPAPEGFQSVRSHGGRLASVARDVWEHFGSGARTTLWDLSVWHAAALSREVAVVRRAPHPVPDELWLYRSGADESVAGFASRIAALEEPQERRGCV